MVGLAIAVIMAVIDTTRSVAASDIVMTPLGQSWQAVSPGTLVEVKAALERHGLTLLWDPLIVWVLTLPGFAVFAFLALLFHLAGRKPTRRYDMLAE